MNRFKNIVAWIFGISFIATGILKLIDLDTMSGSLFKRANYPQWLWLFTGVLELTGGVLAVVKPTRQFGFLLIVVVMCGAIGTHLYVKDNIGHIVTPFIIIVLSIIAAVNKKS